MRVSFTIKQRHALWQKKHFSLLLPFFILLTSVIAIFTSYAPANAATSDTLNFQGRLLSNSGALVSDGSYNMEFNLYTVDVGGASEWTETRLVSGAQGVTVQNGYFSVYLGDVTVFPGSINWDQEHWLGMTVRGTDSCAFGSCIPTDAEMTPRMKLTAVPYAFTAGAVLDSSGTAFTGDDLIQASPATVQTINAAVSALRLNQTGAGGLFEIQVGGTDVFTVLNSGDTTIAGSLTLGTATEAGLFTLEDGAGNGFTLQQGSQAGDLTFTLPENYGVADQCLKTDGTGVLSFGNCPGGSFSVVKTLDEDVVASTALQDDDELTFEVLADEVWTVEFNLQATSNTTADYQFAVTAPAGSTCYVGAENFESAQTKNQFACGVSSTVISSQNASDDYRVIATILVGGTDGDVTLQWAQNTASGTTTVHAGSYLVAREEGGSGGGGGGGGGDSFVQNGNAFLTTAILGTTDTQGLNIITDNTTQLAITSSGDATFSQSLTVSTGGLTLSGGLDNNTGGITEAGAISGVSSISGDAALTISSGGAGDLILDSASDVLILSDATLRRAATGTTTIDLLDATGTTTLSLLNSGAGQVADLLVEGTVSANSFSGSGSGLTSLNADNISSGTVADARLSSNVALLNATQTFTQLTGFSAGLNVGNTADTTAGNIRWTGVDLEVYDGSGWVSLTGGGGGALEFSVFYAYDSVGDIDISSGWTDITLDTEVKEDAPYSHAADSSNVTITEDGWYEITYNIGTYQSAGDVRSDSEAKLQEDTGGGFTDVPGSFSTIYNRQVSQGRGSASVTILREFFNGDIMKLQAQRLSGTGTILTEGDTAGLSIKKIDPDSGGGGGGTSFDQGGNSFGAKGLLGTTDAFGLDVIVNGTAALAFTSGGAATLNNGLTISAGALNLSSGDITNVGNITASAGLTISSGGAGDLTLDSASDILILADDTIQRTAMGTTTIDLVDASATTTLSILNSNGGQVANLTVEGDITAVNYFGSGASLTSLNASSISAGTLADARLTSNVALLDTAQTFTALPSFSAGLTLGNTAVATAGNIRWTGTDFEGYDGTDWLSLSDSGADVVTVIKSVDEIVNNSATLQDDDALFFDVDANQVWTFDFVLQANSGTTPDLRFAVTAPAGSICDVGYENTEFAATVGQYGCGVTTNRVASSGNDEVIRVTGTVRTSGTAGQVTLQWAQFTANASDSTVYSGSYVQAVEENGGSGGGGGGGGTSFDQGGNNFGAIGILGTTDAFGLDIVTNGVTALALTSGGAATFNNGLTISSGAFAVNGGSVTSTGSLSISSGGGGDLTLDSASDILVLSDSTLRRSASGTTTIDLLDSGADTTLSLVNSDGSQQANLSVEGSVTAVDFSGIFSGDGSGVTSISGGNISTGTLADARLSTNVAFINASQTFSGTPTFSTGIVLGNSASTTAGATRWSGTDFEGFDGVSWVSLTGGGGGGGPLSVSFIQTFDNSGGTLVNTVTPTAIPWDSETHKDSGFTHDNVTNNSRITLDAASWYKISYNVSAETTDAVRSNTFCQVRLNGSTFVPTSSSYSYSRQTTDPNTTNVATFYYETTSLNEYYEVLCSRSGSAANHVAIAGQSWTIAEIATTGGGGGSDFTQGGNAFAGTAILGTTDAFGISIITNGSLAQSFTSGGDVTFVNDVTVSGNLIIGAPPSPDALAQTVLFTDVAINKGLVIQGTSSQSASLLEFQDNSGNILSRFDEAGGLVLGRSTATDGTILFNNSTNSNTVTLTTNAVLGTRIISLPDEDGTICLIGSTNCGFIETGSGTIYTDATTNDTLAFNKTNATGNLLLFQRSGAVVFTVANNGALQVQATVATALDIRNAGGTSYLTVDTATGTTTIDTLALTNGITGAGLTDCDGVYDSLQWDIATGLFSCRDDTPQVRSFVDTTSDTAVDANTTDYWDTAAENNNSYPIITPSSVAYSVLGSVTVEFNSTTAQNRDIVARVERGIGSAPICGSGTVVGGNLGYFSTNTGLSKSGTISFLDDSATTSDVYYTVCSDSGSNNVGGISITRIRVTLQEVNNTN